MQRQPMETHRPGRQRNLRSTLLPCRELPQTGPGSASSTVDRWMTPLRLCESCQPHSTIGEPDPMAPGCSLETTATSAEGHHCPAMGPTAPWSETRINRQRRLACVPGSTSSCPSGAGPEHLRRLRPADGDALAGDQVVGRKGPPLQVLSQPQPSWARWTASKPLSSASGRRRGPDHEPESRGTWVDPGGIAHRISGGGASVRRSKHGIFGASLRSARDSLGSP